MTALIGSRQILAVEADNEAKTIIVENKDYNNIYDPDYMHRVYKISHTNVIHVKDGCWHIYYSKGAEDNPTYKALKSKMWPRTIYYTECNDELSTIYIAKHSAHGSEDMRVGLLNEFISEIKEEEEIKKRVDDEFGCIIL